MLSVTASIIETIVIKSSVFAGQQLLNIVYYGGASLYNWYNPTLSETQLLQKEVKMLKNELFDLKEAQYKKTPTELSQGFNAPEGRAIRVPGSSRAKCKGCFA